MISSARRSTHGVSGTRLKVLWLREHHSAGLYAHGEREFLVGRERGKSVVTDSLSLESGMKGRTRNPTRIRITRLVSVRGDLQH